MEFGLDLLLFLIPLYFFLILNPKKSLTSFFKSQGIKKIKFVDLLKQTFTLLFTLFFLSVTINVISVFFNVSDLSLVSAEIVTIPFLLIVYMFVVRVFLEEWFFRSFLIPKMGVVLASLVFALAHVGYGSIIQLVGAFYLGIVLSYFYKKNDNIFPNYLAHLLYNLIVYSFLFI